MPATLYTDASIHPTGAGGWAMWAASPNGRLIHGGVIPRPLSANSTYGEMAAVVAGLHAIRANWLNVDEVLVRCDNQSVTMALGGQGNPARIFQRHEVMRALAADIERLGVKITPVWVRGHQTADTRPAYVNREVDRIAKTHMRQSLRALMEGAQLDTTRWLEEARAAPPIEPTPTRVSNFDRQTWYCFPAKFDSWCAGCGRPVPTGAPVMWRKGQRAYDPACWSAVHEGALPY